MGTELYQKEVKMAQRADFSDDFKNELDSVQIAKAQSFITNFKVEHERIEDMFAAMEFNDEYAGDKIAMLKAIQDKLIEEQQEKNAGPKGEGAKGAAASTRTTN